MKRLFSNVCALAAVLLVSGCAYFRPSQTEEARLQEQERIAKDEYLKRSIFDGLVHAAGSYLNH
jgi:hypothetical protein